MSRFERRILIPLLMGGLLFGGPLVSASRADGSGVRLVSARNGPVASLTRNEAEQLFLGRRTTLSDGTPVTLIDLPAGTIRDQLYLLLTGKNPIQTRAYWSRQVFTGRAQPPREAASAEQASDWIASTPGAIGYLPANHADSRLQTLLPLP